MPDYNRYARGLAIMEEVQGREGAAEILEGLGGMHPDLPGPRRPGPSVPRQSPTRGTGKGVKAG